MLCYANIKIIQSLWRRKYIYCLDICPEDIFNNTECLVCAYMLVFNVSVNHEPAKPYALSPL